jgi:hypothetical protein
MKILARKGVTIVYPKKVRDPDGTRRQLVDHIPPDRDAFIVWRDQFGTIHGLGFGDIETQPEDPDESIDEFVTRALRRF